MSAKDREHFIPIRKSELVRLLIGDRCLQYGRPLSPSDQEAFLQFARLLSAHLHFDSHDRLDHLKELYAPFDPDADTRTLFPIKEEARQPLQDTLFEQVGALLKSANYIKLTDEQILEATTMSSEWGLRMDVDLTAFERIEVYVRGQVIGRRTHRFLRNWYRLEEVTVPIYQRVVLILKQRPHPRFGPEADIRNIYLKLFKDLPRADLEMIIPGTRVKMPGIDRLKLGGSFFFAIALIIYQTVSKFFGVVMALWAGVVNIYGLLFGPIALLIGYGYKQFAGYQQTKQAYRLRLTQSLYYQNLASNQAVLRTLLDKADEQEFREAVLAYFYLWRYAADPGWTAEQLDHYAEIDLERRAGIHIDFEIDDALAKLERFGLVLHEGDRYRAVPMPLALQRLDTLWNCHFQHGGCLELIPQTAS